MNNNNFTVFELIAREIFLHDEAAKHVKKNFKLISEEVKIKNDEAAKHVKKNFKLILEEVKVKKEQYMKSNLLNINVSPLKNRTLKIDQDLINLFDLKKKLKMSTNTLDLESLRKKKDQIKPTIEVKSQLTREAAEKVVNIIAKKKGCNYTDATVLISGVLQKGGTNKGATDISMEFDDLKLTTSELNSTVKMVEKNATTRQLARTLCQEIFDVCEVLEMPGDLSNQMLLEYPELTIEEQIWCSNFQTKNPNCPDRVREWLVDNFRNRFSK